MIDINFLIAGVGGQGALLASNVLAEVGVTAGYDVKKVEVHGMSQRGGSVTSHIRWGIKVHSPVIAQGEIDSMLALEKLEGLRNIKMVRPGGTVLIGEVMIPPLTVSSGNDVYPEDEEIIETISEITSNYFFVPTITIAKNMGNARAHNVVLLGAQSVFINHISTDIWMNVIRKHVPSRFIALNQDAFNAGRAFGLMNID